MDEGHTTPSASEHRAVLEEQVRVAYSQTGRAVFGGSFTAMLLAWVFAGAADGPVILAWLGCVLALTSIRGFVYLAYRRRPPTDDPRVWLRRLVLGTFLTACAWSAAWWVLIPVPGGPEYTMILMAWMLGISAASVSAYSISLPAVFAFFGPTILPGIPRLLLIGGRLELGAALGLVVYAYVVLTSMLPIHRGINDAIRLNFVNAREIRERKHVEGLLRELSSTDSLTGLSTRGRFDDALRNELSRASRTESPVALILADIDSFKLLNDSQGHVEGDNCLKRVAVAVRATGMRPGDVVARYGGEELAVLLPNTDLAQAAALAEDLRARVEALGLPHPETRVEGMDTVTLSVGVAALVPSAGTTPGDLIGRADSALYRAKQGGRNRVEAAGAEPE